MNNRFLWRARWAALGAAVAVSLGGGGAYLAMAEVSPNESSVVNVTPTRVLDTRDPRNLGLAGPFTSEVSQKLQITGSIAVDGGPNTTVVPAGATGVLMNVTAVGPTSAGFVSIRPGDATGAPSTSSLNVEAGSITPNAVQVSLPTTGPNAGQIDITYNAYGVAGQSTDILIDVIGYTTNAGLQELDDNTPIVAFNNANAGITLDSEKVVLSTTITPPSNGSVKASSSAVVAYQDDLITCSLTLGTTYDAAHEQGVGYLTGAVSFDTLSGLRVFEAVAGVPLTINLVCEAESTTDAIVYDRAITAEFFPNSVPSALTEADSAPTLADIAGAD